MLLLQSFTLHVYHVFNRRLKEISQKTAEEEERYKKEMDKYTTNFVLKMFIKCKLSTIKYLTSVF